MKKLILVTGILFYGFATANEVPVKNGDTKNHKPERQINSKKIVLVAPPQVWYGETSCGVVATTTQDWTAQQANDWLSALEANYCKSPTYYGNDPGHLASN